MLKRFRAFVDRDEILRETIVRQLYDRAGSLTRDPFEVPMKHKLALVRIGLSLFQALFYRENKQVLGSGDHVLVRYATNCVDSSESEWLTEFASVLRVQTPPCADRHVEPRFVFGTRLIAEGVTAIGAEIPGSTTWYGAVHRQEPSMDLVEYFDWFTGDGRLIRSNDETEPAAKFRSPAQ